MKSLIFDTETTGLTLPVLAPIESQPRIFEIGAVLIENGEIQLQLSQLVNPGQEIPAKIVKMTGITNEDVQTAPTLIEVVPRLKEMFSAADTLICHNASFDVNVLGFELQRLGVDDFPWPVEITCTVQEYYALFGRRPTLKDIYKHSLGEELKQTHRALEDVLALFTVLKKDGWFLNEKD